MCCSPCCTRSSILLRLRPSERLAYVKQANQAADGADVTVLVSPAPTARSSEPADSRWLVRYLPHLLVGLAVGWALMPFAKAFGGRGPMALTKVDVLALAALIAVRPWRLVRTPILVVAGCISVAALVVCLVTPPGWLGANRAASYGLAAALFVVVAAFARSRQRRAPIGALVVLAGGVQFFWSFVSWWGGRSPTAVMVGTFYWHNQFGGFLLAPAIIGMSFVLANKAPWRLVGWVVVPFAVAGVIYSSSRGAQLILVLSWICLGVLALRMRSGVRRALGRYLGLSVLCVVASFVLAGPLFFHGWHVPWASTQARAATGETLTQNGGFRIHIWRESVAVIEHNPIIGVGYGALAPAAVKVTPRWWPHSPLSHDDYLQALVDGGLLLGLPFLIACGWIALRLSRQLISVGRRRIADPMRIGFVLAAAAMMAHSTIDFDWSYPALFATAAIVAGLAVAPATVRRVPTLALPRVRPTVAGIAATAVLGIAVATGAIAGHKGGIALVVRIPPLASTVHSTSATPVGVKHP